MNEEQTLGKCFGVPLSELTGFLYDVTGGSGISWKTVPKNKYIVFLPEGGTFDIRVEAMRATESYFGSAHISFAHEDELELAVHALAGNKAMIAGAESCTGGLVSGLLTSKPGSSDYFWGGWVCYANDAKISALGVEKDIIETYGAVSEQTARAMAVRARELSGCGIGYSITGIAGPGGGSDEKPVGTVWMGISSPERVWTGKFLFDGNREKVRNQAAYAMLHNIYTFFRNGV